jgi:hypothetical protein
VQAHKHRSSFAVVFSTMGQCATGVLPSLSRQPGLLRCVCFLLPARWCASMSQALHWMRSAWQTCARQCASHTRCVQGSTCCSFSARLACLYPARLCTSLPDGEIMMCLVFCNGLQGSARVRALLLTCVAAVTAELLLLLLLSGGGRVPARCLQRAAAGGTAAGESQRVAPNASISTAQPGVTATPLTPPCLLWGRHVHMSQGNLSRLQ